MYKITVSYGKNAARNSLPGDPMSDHVSSDAHVDTYEMKVSSYDHVRVEMALDNDPAVITFDSEIVSEESERD